MCVCVWRGGGVSHHGHVNKEVLKESPHVSAGVDLLHLHLCVHIAVVQEVDVGRLNLNKTENHPSYATEFTSQNPHYHHHHHHHHYQY